MAIPPSIPLGKAGSVFKSRFLTGALDDIVGEASNKSVKGCVEG